MNTHDELGLRSGPLGHSFYLSYSLNCSLICLAKALLGLFTPFSEHLVPASGISYLIYGYPDIWTCGSLDILISQEYPEGGEGGKRGQGGGVNNLTFVCYFVHIFRHW